MSPYILPAIKAKRANAAAAQDPQGSQSHSSADARAGLSAALDGLRKRLVGDFYHREGVALTQGHLHRVADRAAAMAWTTEFPLLFFPVLFYEFAHAERRRAVKQQEILARSKILAQRAFAE